MTIEVAPEDILDYGLDWTDWLNGDTILTSTWAVGVLTKTNEVTAPAIATLFLAGWIAGHSYLVFNLIHTTGGRNKRLASYRMA